MNNAALQTLRSIREYSDSQPARALHALRELLAAAPDFLPARVEYAVLLCELARYDESERELRAALRLASDDSRYLPYYFLGCLNQERGELLLAEGWFEKAIALRPDHATPRIMLGAVLAKRGKLDAAEQTHRAATVCASGCVDEAYFNLGLVLRAQERYREALECFERALELDPDYERAAQARLDVASVLEAQSDKH